MIFKQKSRTIIYMFIYYLGDTLCYKGMTVIVMSLRLKVRTHGRWIILLKPDCLWPHYYTIGE